MANEKHLYCGKTDLDLSEKGRADLLKKNSASKLSGAGLALNETFGQSESIYEKIIFPDISHCKIFTSGMKRTNQTLSLLYPDLANSAIEERSFRELDFGDFEMKSYDELKDDESYRAWVQGEVDRIQAGLTEFKDNPCPNGESWLKMTERVLAALEKAVKFANSIAIFTHGGVISAIMQHFFPNERKSIYEWQPNFGEGYRILLRGEPVAEN